MTLAHPKDAGKSKSRFFDKNLSHVILTVKGAAENRSSFAVGGPGASERGVKKNHDLIRNLKS